jgi:hypothetical protein
VYLNISKDISMIKDALNNNTPNYKLAQAIYMDGANARQPDGRLFPLRAVSECPRLFTPLPPPLPPPPPRIRGLSFQRLHV